MQGHEGDTGQKHTKLYQEVYDACMAYVASINGVAPSPEVLSIVASATAQAVSQSKDGVGGAGACIAQALGLVTAQVTNVREVIQATRAVSAGALKLAKKIVKQASKIAFEADKVVWDGMAVPMSTTDEEYIEAALEGMFKQGGELQVGAEYVLTRKGALMLKMPLPGAAGRYVMLPAESLRYVEVQQTADGYHNLIVMSAPKLGADGTASQMQRSVITLSPEKMGAIVGSDVTVDVLAERMQGADFARQIFEAHREVMRFETMRRAMEAQAREIEQEREAERLAVEQIDLLSAVEAPPTELPPQLIANDNTQPKLSAVM
jgi:hypothetical protein